MAGAVFVATEPRYEWSKHWNLCFAFEAKKNYREKKKTKLSFDLHFLENWFYLNFFSSESPNDSGYGTGGSGDCYASDDEDCYQEGSSEGSGSHEGGVGGSPYDDDDNDDDDEGSGGWEAEVNEGPKWPPWTVTQVPPKDDVMLEEDSKGVNSQGGEQTPRIATAGGWRLQQGLLIYLLPLFVARIARLS